MLRIGFFEMMNHQNAFLAIGRTILLYSFSLIIGVIFSGCAMRSMHYKSFLELHEEATENYTSQVFNTLVMMWEDGELPILFNIEAGASLWTPGYSLTISGLVLPLFDADQSSLTTTAAGNETVTNQIQFNDFGSDAMLRTTMIYGYLCFPIDFGDGLILPNGSLYTIVDIRDTPEGLSKWRKLKDNRYMGVPEEKQEDFVRFARDIVYWTRNADPNPKDLISIPGSLYRFSVTYSSSIKELAQAVLSYEEAKKGLKNAQETVQQVQTEFDQLKQEAKTTQTNPAIMQTLLQIKQEDVQTKQQQLASLSSQIMQAESKINQKSSELNLLVASIVGSLNKVEKYDPEVANETIQNIINLFNEPVEKILHGDDKALKKYSNMLAEPSALDAKESVDDLYRERFESLPLQFNPAAGQALQ